MERDHGYCRAAVVACSTDVARTKRLVTPASQGFAVTFLDPRIRMEMTLIARQGAGARASA